MTAITHARSMVMAGLATAILAGGASAAAASGLESVGTGSSNAPAATASVYEAATKYNDVSVRPCPHTTKNNSKCRPTGYMLISGSIFYATCYVTGDSISGDNIWYYGRHPDRDFENGTLAGYVAGWDLDTGHDPRKGIGKC